MSEILCELFLLFILQIRLNNSHDQSRQTESLCKDVYKLNMIEVLAEGLFLLDLDSLVHQCLVVDSNHLLVEAIEGAPCFLMTIINNAGLKKLIFNPRRVSSQGAILVIFG